MSTDDFLRALVDLDEEFREALVEALETEPEKLRAFLVERGFEPGHRDGDDRTDEWTVVSDESSEDVPADSVEWEPDVDLTPAEDALYSVVETIETPRTAEEVCDLIGAEKPEFAEKFSSLESRAWVSRKLNKFAKEGLLGKYRDGREIRYTADIGRAISNWARKNEVFPDELNADEHTDRIVADTNMNRHAIEAVLRGGD